MSPRPDLAVVVLATGSVPEIGAAFQSLLAQSEPVEIAVVHSGAAAEHLTDRLPAGAERFAAPELLLTGAARNRGVAMTSAPWVAFLAADCLALPGWVENRLRAHRLGIPVVAAALVNPHPRSAVAWAAYIALHHRRWPTLNAEQALHYGASYAREALAAVGGFDPALAVGEDTDLHRRLAARGFRTHWEPRVRATHPYPTSARAFREEQWGRGRRGAVAWLAQGQPDLARELAQDWYRRAVRALRFAWAHAGSATARMRIARASAWVFEGSRCYSRGAQAALANR